MCAQQHTHASAQIHIKIKSQTVQQNWVTECLSYWEHEVLQITGRAKGELQLDTERARKWTQSFQHDRNRNMKTGKRVSNLAHALWLYIHNVQANTLPYIGRIFFILPIVPFRQQYTRLWLGEGGSPPPFLEIIIFPPMCIHSMHYWGTSAALTSFQLLLHSGCVARPLSPF